MSGQCLGKFKPCKVKAALLNSSTKTSGQNPGLMILMSKRTEMNFCFDFSALCGCFFWHRLDLEIQKYHKEGRKCSISCSIQGKVKKYFPDGLSQGNYPSP